MLDPKDCGTNVKGDWNFKKIFIFSCLTYLTNLQNLRQILAERNQTKILMFQEDTVVSGPGVMAPRQKYIIPKLSIF